MPGVAGLAACAIWIPRFGQQDTALFGSCYLLWTGIPLFSAEANAALPNKPPVNEGGALEKAAKLKPDVVLLIGW